MLFGLKKKTKSYYGYEGLREKRVKLGFNNLK